MNLQMRPSFRLCLWPLLVSTCILSTLIRHTYSFQHIKQIGIIRSPKYSFSRTSSSFRPLDKKVVSENQLQTKLHLSASPLVSSILNPLGSVSVLAFVVLVHECGHFLAARSLGIAVKEFSVGVGPKVAGFSREADDGTIDFSLRAFPLGGYVQFPENYNATLYFEKQEEQRLARKELRESEESSSSNAESQNKPNMILNLFNKENARKAEEERILKQKEEEKLKQNAKWWNSFSLQQSSATNNKKKKKTKASLEPIEIQYYDDPNLLQNRPWGERAIVLVGGVVFNIILAFTLYFGELTVGAGIPKPVFQSGAVVSQVPRPGGPSVGLLNKGDVIMGINGQRLTASDSPTAYEAQESITKFIEKIRASEPGDSLHLSILKYASQSPVEVDVSPKQTIDGPMSIGVSLTPNYQGRSLVRATSIPDAVGKAGTEVRDLTADTARSILALLGSLIAGRGTPVGQTVSGPIGVLKTGTDVVSTNDISAVIGFVSAISVNLAVVNSLPLPALDGGQLAFVLSEAITGKKIDQRKQEAINAAAFLFLLAVSFGTVVGDLNLVGRMGR